MSITVDPPSKLPVGSLSLSSIKTFCQCPERWRRRYLEREYEMPSGKMILGSAAGAAEAQHFSDVIEGGEGFTPERVLDEFSAEWDQRISAEDVDFGNDRPGELKDSGAGALDVYHRHIVPSIQPVCVEREFVFSWPGLDWFVNGFIDLEEANDSVGDLKMKGRRLDQRSADVDLQATMYLAARRAEGNPATGFDFHCMVRSKKPTAELVHTRRTASQLDQLTDRIFSVAAEMAWRTEFDVWTGAAPGLFKPASDVCAGCKYMDCDWRLG